MSVPLRSLDFSLRLPRADALGCILSPLRGWAKWRGWPNQVGANSPPSFLRSISSVNLGWPAQARLWLEWALQSWPWLDSLKSKSLQFRCGTEWGRDPRLWLVFAL